MSMNDAQKIQLLRLMADGKTNDQIAQHIRMQRDRNRPGWGHWSETITSNAVNKCIGALLVELGVTSGPQNNARTKGVHLAYQKGYLLTDAATEVLSRVVTAIVEHERQAGVHKTDPDDIAVEVREAIGPMLFERLAGALAAAQEEGVARDG